MKKFLTLTPMLIFLITTNAQPEDCEIPGKTIHWIVDYCMYQGESDDFLDEKVQACFERNQGYKVTDTCENKKKYKMKMCTHLAEKGYFNSNAEICFKDLEFIPATVKNDGI
jgi:hypothetical protein